MSSLPITHVWRYTHRRRFRYLRILRHACLSASDWLHTSVFEPIHGSYPQAAGKNIANPLATILSAAMMFEYAFGLKEEALSIQTAVSESMNAGIVTEDLAGTMYEILPYRRRRRMDCRMDKKPLIKAIIKRIVKF